MIALSTSKVAKVIADNLDLCNKPGGLHIIGRRADVQTVPGRNVVVVSFNGATFAGAFTKAGWRALPAMTSLAGKKLYTDAEAETAVKAIFAAVKDAASRRRPGHAPGHE
jgi:hypothetical protein